MSKADMKFTPTLIVCPACSDPMHIGHTCRQFVPFTIELRLKVTIASLPQRLRTRLGKQGISPRRGDSTAYVSSDEPQLIDELLREFGAYGNREGFSMIARLDQGWRWPAWVTVHSIARDRPSPYAAFMFELRKNIASCIERKIAEPDAVHYLFVDGREWLAKESARKAERERALLFERALVVAEKLRALTVSQIASLAVERRAVETLEAMITVPGKDNSP